MRGLLFAETPGLGERVHNIVTTKDPTALLAQLADEPGVAETFLTRRQLKRQRVVSLVPGRPSVV